ncbi:hypothetical protein [Winogradskyella tangerina]|uniref:hypothetical protein n=1 Tax=Winogradskyella tangerina TaxID=2023240 RepID=UPI000DBE8E6D|nr:hypothetical protein [Winogradskyella tangerina]
MSTFKKRQLSFILKLLIVSGILFGAHSYVLYQFASSVEFFFPLWQIYAFHFVVTLLFFSIINYRFAAGQKNIINLFMILTFSKIALSIIFLLPFLLSDFENTQPDFLNFFVPYFLYLFFEVYAISKFLQKA